jgi:transposase
VVTGHPELRQLYDTKEAMHSLYRIRGHHRAKTALTALTDRFATSTLPELQTSRRTLMRWRREILAHFGTGLTNARTEGFNNKAKLVKKRAYGYRSFPNYRLRLLMRAPERLSASTHHGVRRTASSRNRWKAITRTYSCRGERI